VYKKGGIKKKMRKLLKSKKALSPVIAAIILIAVTVAVSIAVAAWMGALTFTFMATEQLGFTNCVWDTSGYTWVELTVKNTGTSSLTLSQVKINNYLNISAGWTLDSGETVTLTPNAVVHINITATNYPLAAGIVSSKFARGAYYAFTVVTAKNNPFGPYTANAPS
jgi:flagellin-like protein